MKNPLIGLAQTSIRSDLGDAACWQVSLHKQVSKTSITQTARSGLGPCLISITVLELTVEIAHND